MSHRWAPRVESVRVSVIVVSAGTRALLDDCLRSLPTAAAGLETEVIVVDNASADGSVDLVRTEHSDVVLIANDKNFGFAHANNQGLWIARGEYALLLNSDTVASPGSIAQLVAFLDDRSGAGVCAPRLVDATGAPDASASGLPNLRMQVASFLSLKRLMPRSLLRLLLAAQSSRVILQWVTAGYFTPAVDSDAPRQVDFLSGACLLVRRAVWETVGGLDENIFLYLEDADWCRRISNAGWSLWYVPEVTVVHLGGRSFAARTGGRSHHLSRERLESLFYYFRKHESAASRVALKVVVVTSLSLRLLGAIASRNRDDVKRLRCRVRLAVKS